MPHALTGFSFKYITTIICHCVKILLAISLSVLFSHYTFNCHNFNTILSKEYYSVCMKTWTIPHYISYREYCCRRVKNHLAAWQYSHKIKAIFIQPDSIFFTKITVANSIFRDFSPPPRLRLPFLMFLFHIFLSILKLICFLFLSCKLFWFSFYVVLWS